MNEQAALQTFWSGFNWDAFEENAVPENAFATRDHYLTYAAGLSGFDEPMMLTASLWQRSKSWTDTVNKSREIFEEIGLGGVLLQTDDGYVWIKRGQPFAQRMSDEDPTVRRIYLNVEVEFFTSK